MTSGTVVKSSETVKDMGVIFDNELTFRNHVEGIVSSAYKSLGFTIRDFTQFKDQQALLILYKSFVRSKLEYACLVWSPIYYTHAWSLEKFQRPLCKTFIFRCTGEYPIRHSPHENLLQYVQ